MLVSRSSSFRLEPFSERAPLPEVFPYLESFHHIISLSFCFMSCCLLYIVISLMRESEAYLIFSVLVPSVEVVQSQIVVEENVGQVRVPLRRTGDASQGLLVTCLTTSRIEEGTVTKCNRRRNLVSTGKG